MIKACSALAWVRLVLISWLPVIGQVAEFELKGDQLRIRTQSGKAHQVQAIRANPESFRLSPDRTKLVWHETFAGYAANTTLPVRLWALSQPGSAREFRVPTMSRYINRVEWIDNSLVLFSGDGYGVLVDVEAGALRAAIPGPDITFSPDRRLILYWSDIGRSAPDFASHEVFLQIMNVQPPEAKSVPQARPAAYKLYPPDEELERCAALNWNTDRPECRHSALTPFAWFSDSRRAVFLEWHDGSVWAVILTIDLDGSALSVHHEKFRLPVAEQISFERISWLKQDEELEAKTKGMPPITEGRRIIVNLKRQTVTFDEPK